jgi:hypothetical protein
MQLTRWVVLATLVACMSACAQTNDDGQAAITAKAVELAPTNSPAATRIIALHTFVRDEIRQVPTTYG